MWKKMRTAVPYVTSIFALVRNGGEQIIAFEVSRVCFVWNFRMVGFADDSSSCRRLRMAVEVDDDTRLRKG
ncbi:hypothetical protein CEXT_197061 [Caerostris extrusa]|uniref:Uncharacterized protein n=1 Tax=Caerostris extrusa TaxID=172846 RepID=A0AAV4S4U1_CAEEX|nr:hypothetical protein CEXT_197061 [Caerostris extrusa]